MSGEHFLGGWCMLWLRMWVRHWVDDRGLRTRAATIYWSWFPWGGRQSTFYWQAYDSSGQMIDQGAVFKLSRAKAKVDECLRSL